MKPEATPGRDLVTFLTNPIWPTAVFWLLLLVGLGIAFSAWQREPDQRSPRTIGIAALRMLTGAMWWQQSLWKIPPNYDGLLFWMKQIIAHSSIPLQASMVERFVIPNIAVFGPLVYLTEALIGVAFILGAFTRVFAILGLLLTLNLWVGLYSAPNEWPWTYAFLIIIQALFAIDPPGRRLGLEKSVPVVPRGPSRVELIRRRL